MTTPIKFRGFRVDGKGWVERDLIRDALGGTRITQIDKSGKGLIFNHIHPSSLGMFTGLHDKNGREIYGAIGEKGGDNLLYIGTNMSSMDVIFKDGMFVGVGSFNTHPLHTYFTATDFESIEIIGNQFEQNNGK